MEQQREASQRPHWEISSLLQQLWSTGALQSMPCLLMQEHLFIRAWTESQSTYSFSSPPGRQGEQINDISGNTVSLNKGIWPVLSESGFRSVHQISAFVFAALIPGTFSC